MSLRSRLNAVGRRLGDGCAACAGVKNVAVQWSEDRKRPARVLCKQCGRDTTLVIVVTYEESKKGAA